MNVLLDTHAFMWFVWNDPKLSKVAKDTIVNPDNRKLVSTASCWELAIKVSLKKLDLGMPYQQFVRPQMEKNNFELLTIDHDHLAGVVTLPLHHRDPFDRMLIAQCIAEGIPIISADEQLDAYAIERVW